MNTGDATRRLSVESPWWSRADWRERDEDLIRVALAPFAYHPAVLDDLVEGGLYILRGVRRSGKSVTMKQTISRLLAEGISPRRVIHFTCDGLSMDDFAKLVDVAGTVSTAGVQEHRYWFIDEITSLSGQWSKRVKALRDGTPFGRDTVVLTGSSMAGLQDAQDDLAGRRGGVANSDRLLFPMSFRQFWNAMGNRDAPPMETVHPSQFRSEATRRALEQMVPAYLDRFLTAWELYLTVGGFPDAIAEFVKSSAVTPGVYQTFFDVIGADLNRNSRSFNSAKTLGLLTLLTDRLANPVNASSVAAEIGVADVTVAAKIQALTTHFVVWPCAFQGRRRRPVHESDAGVAAPLSTEGAYRKIYFVDPLFSQIGFGRNPSRAVPDLSVLSEQQIGLALIRQAEARYPGTYADFSHVMYGRTNRREVDFAGPWMDDVAFEGKYVDRYWRRDAATVEAFSPGNGVLATRQAFDLRGSVWAVPAPFVAWFLEPAG